MAHRPTRTSRLRQLLINVLSFGAITASMPASAAIMISQVYGGGGSTGAPLSREMLLLWGPAHECARDRNVNSVDDISPGHCELRVLRFAHLVPPLLPFGRFGTTGDSDQAA